MVQPAKGTTAVRKGKYVGESAFMRITPDGEFNGDDGS